MTRKIVLDLKLGIHTVEQFQVGTQLVGFTSTYITVKLTAVHIAQLDTLGNDLLVGSEEIEIFLIHVIHALKCLAYSYRPRKRSHRYLQFALQLVEDVKGITTLAVELVDKHNNRCIAHATHLHELACLLLHTLCHVDHDNNTVNGSKCAIGILGKVLVTGGIKNIYFVVAIVKSHDRCCNRYTTLLFYLHPVAGGSFLYLIGLYGTGNVDSTTKKQQLLGKGGFTGIGVTDNSKRTSFCDFVGKCTHNLYVS